MMLLARILFAATLPLGVWPEALGPPALTVAEVPMYTVEPEEDYGIVAVVPIIPPVPLGARARLLELAQVARRLGADAVLLLGETSVEAIPEDPTEPLPTTERFAAGVFIVFDLACEGEEQPVQRAFLSPARMAAGSGAWPGKAPGPRRGRAGAGL